MGSQGPPQGWLALLGGVIAGLALGAALFFGLAPAAPTATQDSSLPEMVQPAAPIQGAPAPDFTLSTLEGDLITLSDLRGQVVLVNFWATWCGPCKLEFPALDDRYTHYRDQGFEILAINLNEPADLITSFAEEMGTNLPLQLHSFPC